VTGAGRLQFYSAPNQSCAMAGVFVIPKDELIAYAQSSEWLVVGDVFQPQDQRLRLGKIIAPESNGNGWTLVEP
jgi:hypothetical protein